MERIASFSVDHTKLLPGLYVSRVDRMGDVAVTTFDLRMTAPNIEPVMDTAAVHAIEHIGATFLRNSAWGTRIIYFGPMGCRTGFYLVVFGTVTAQEVLPLVRDCMQYIADFTGDIPGASAVECGNYLDLNAKMASYHAARYLAALETPHLVYPTEKEGEHAI